MYHIAWNHSLSGLRVPANMVPAMADEVGMGRRNTVKSKATVTAATSPRCHTSW